MIWPLKIAKIEKYEKNLKIEICKIVSFAILEFKTTFSI